MQNFGEGQDKAHHGLGDEVNRLFAETRSFRNSSEFENMMDFIGRRSKIAPFNSYLLYLQRPDISYAATRADWLKENRTVSSDARPLVILRPFGPIDLVYDIRDTSGEQFIDLGRLEWWRSDGAVLDREIEGIVQGMADIGLVIAPMDIERTHSEFPHRMPHGQAVAYSHGMRVVQLRPGADPSNLSMFMGILFHEYAHHLLGHLGSWAFPHPQKGPIPVCEHDRSQLSHDQKEWEAEVVAFLCCNRVGLSMGAREYLAMHMGPTGEIPDMDITAVLTVAHRILKGKFPQGSHYNENESQLGLDL